MSPQEYVKRYYITNIYYMKNDNEFTVILLSCEQCPVVYLENIIFATKYLKYSLGQIAYDMYLKRLIEKGKQEVYLLGGDYAYKKRYGSKKRMVVEYSIIRKSIKSYFCIYGKRRLVKIFSFLPDNIKKDYIQNDNKVGLYYER